MQVKDLRCEYFTNPIGLDVTSPRLSWKLVSERRGARQSAYQIIAEGDAGLSWDSGKVTSDQSVHVAYAGPALVSSQRVSWKVKVWDEQDRPGDFSQPAFWEMGLLQPADWKAEWIGSSGVGGPRVTAPVPYLRKNFQVKKTVTRARLVASALGAFEMQINGQPVSQEVLVPGWTDFHKRAQVVVYDVTALLREGENVLGALLGDAWYCGHVAELNRQAYGDRPKLLAQLILSFDDGSTQTVVSDASWKTSTGALLESDLIQGETYDARREMPGWSAPGFDETSWEPVMVFEVPGLALTARKGPAITRHEELQPVADPRVVGEGLGAKWIFDLGQNMAGWARLKVSGPAGTVVRMRFAEVLDTDGSLYVKGLRSARATDYYILKGEGLEVYEPHFTTHGFRYVEVSGVPGSLGRDAVTGVVLYSDTTPSGSFECSDPLVNQLQHNIVWSQKGNFIEVPTDCPQRDERLGWTGDAQVFIRTAAFNMNVGGFFTKWIQDIADSQSERGEIPPVIPRVHPFGLTNDGGPAWADAAIICPWTLYLTYGDQNILAEHYDVYRNFIEYLRSTSVDLIRCHPKAVKEGICWPGFGDWLSTRAETPNDLIGTAFFAYSTRLLSNMAGVLGKKEDQAVYLQLSEDVREAFIRRFVTRDGLVAGLTQTGYVLALYFGLMPEHLRGAALNELTADIQRRGNHLSTGFVGTPYLLQTLTDAGRLDDAYTLLLQKSWPSWLYPVTKGATTIWERWDGWTEDKGFQDPGMNSFNHYAYGAVGAWLYATVAGIDIDPLQPGYKHIVFRPQPGGGLSSAKAVYDSVYGTISSSWRVTPEGFEWSVEVPVNTTAILYVPAPAGAQVLESGLPAGNAEGLSARGREGQTEVFTAQSGIYQLVVRP